jgi:PEP-CTERM motif
MKRFAIFGLFVGALLVGAPKAEAVQLTGTISLSQTGVCGVGQCLIPVMGNVASTLAVATGLDFTTTGVLTPNVAGPMNVDGGTGTLAGALLGPGTIKDFCFVAVGCGVYPGAPLVAWETGPGGGTFSLTSVAINNQNLSVLCLTGTGVFNVVGFDPTPGTFTFSVTQTGGAFSFSSTNAAAPTAVPEPGSMILLGTGLAGLAASVRRRLARKQ